MTGIDWPTAIPALISAAWHCLTMHRNSRRREFVVRIRIGIGIDIGFPLLRSHQFNRAIELNKQRTPEQYRIFVYVARTLDRNQLPALNLESPAEPQF
jgi:hypothetical protein